jgi:hypothetical protein
LHTFVALSSAVFDRLLAPFGHGPAAFDLVLWSVLSGVLALVAYKYVSNQAGIARAKDQIKMHLLEIRLFRHDVRQVLKSTAWVLLRNSAYLGYNLVPMAVLAVPFTAVLVQLVSNYAYAPAPVGTVELLEVRLDEDAAVRPTDVRLDLPAGVVLDAPPVRTPDGEIYWRLRAEAEGDHRLVLTAGSERVEKTWSIGGEPRKVSPLLTSTWEAILYPGEGSLADASAFHEIRLDAPSRPLPFAPDGELGVLTAYMALSLLTGLVLRKPLGVDF